MKAVKKKETDSMFDKIFLISTYILLIFLRFLISPVIFVFIFCYTYLSIILKLLSHIINPFYWIMILFSLFILSWNYYILVSFIIAFDYSKEFIFLGNFNEIGGINNISYRLNGHYD